MVEANPAQTSDKSSADVNLGSSPATVGRKNGADFGRLGASRGLLRNYGNTQHRYHNILPLGIDNIYLFIHRLNTAEHKVKKAAHHAQTDR